MVKKASITRITKGLGLPFVPYAGKSLEPSRTTKGKKPFIVPRNAGAEGLRMKRSARSAEKNLNPLTAISNFWEGGKTAKKKLLRTCADYKAWRLAVFKRDNFICQKCGKHSTDLEAHHLKEVCNYPEQIFDVDNGVTLCHQCHKETDNYGNKARELKITKEGENYGR